MIRVLKCVMTARSQIESLFSQSFEKPSDLLCCAFGLKNSEIDTYFSLLSGPKTVEEIRSIVGCDRSTVQRALMKLRNKGLVERETRHIKRGGYYYVYRALSANEVRRMILELLEKWYRETKKLLLDSWPEQPE